MGAISLVVGLGLITVSFSTGIKPLGLILGGLLVLNGLGRIWVVRQRQALRGNAVSERQHSPHG